MISSVFSLIFLIVLGAGAGLLIRVGIALFRSLVGMGSSGGGNAVEVIRLPTPEEVRERMRNGEISQEEGERMLQDLIVPPHPPPPENSGGLAVAILGISGAAVIGALLAVTIAVVFAVIEAKFIISQS